MKLIAIGFVGNFTVYVNLSKKEAIARYNQENPDWTVEDNNLSVIEQEVVDGKFRVYDIFED
jgi:hypothetical protein